MFSAQDVAGLTREALLPFDGDDLAYLALTGKIELLVRDAIAVLIRRRFPDLTPAREFKRRDLVVLRNGIPQVVIEGKLWISYEANYPEKLHNPNPKDGLVAATRSDIAKMERLFQQHGCERFTSTVLFGADIGDLESKHLPAVKYPDWHRRGPTSHVDHLTAHKSGVENYLEAIRNLGTCSSERLFNGQVFGAPCIADVVICKVDSD